MKADARQQYEAAYEYFKAAWDKKPDDIRYRAAYERERFYAASTKVHRGQLLREQGKLDQALIEFQNAAAIDPSLEIATQEINVTRDMIRNQAAAPAPPAAAPNAPISEMLSEAQGPVQLQPISDQPITLKLTEDTRVIYETIGKLAGINVLFDPDYTSRRIHIELNNVSLQDALQIIALESRTFWRPVTKNTIFIAADNQQKRRELEENVVKTFYLSNVAQPTDLQDIVNILRTVLEIQRIQQLPSQNAIVIRGTPDQLALAEKLIGDLDKARAEVVVDIAVMQVDRNKMRNLGINPPTSVSVNLTNQSFQNLGTTNNTGTTGTGTNGNNNGGTTTNQQQPGGQVTFNTFKHLTSVSYAVTLPPASAQFLFSDSDSQIIQNPQIRALDGQKASLKIGDRVPIATGSFGIPTGIVNGGVGGFNGAVNTQFQYLDVGVNMDLTPIIHNDGDVTLKLSIDISSVTSHVNIGGIDQPVIGQRKIENEIRLKEGEVNIMGGIFEDQEVKSWSGIPGLGHIPLFRYLFAQENKSSDKNEIVFVLIPHIVRRQVLNALNNAAIDIGSGSAIQLRRGSAPAQNSAPVPAQQAAGIQGEGSPATTPNMPGMMPAKTAPAVPSTASPQPQTQPPQSNGSPTPNSSGLPQAQPATISFEPPIVNQASGSTASINVNLASPIPVAAASMQLRYDPRLVQVANVTSGGFLSQDGQAATVVHRDDGNGTLQVSAVRPPGSAGVSGQGTLFTVLFTLKSPGAASIAPLSFVARDAAGNPVATAISGVASLQIQSAKP